MMWNTLCVLAYALLSVAMGAAAFYAGVRAGSRLQWTAGRDEEPFKSKPTKRITETE